jgi:DNA-binding transcriptional ArsR family regulator
MWCESMKRKLSNICYGFFSTLANPTRLAILEKLSESEMNVTQLAQTLKQEQSMISHNLKPLLDCRFIYSERQGKSMIYHINNDTVSVLFKALDNHSQNHCPHDSNCLKSL